MHCDGWHKVCRITLRAAGHGQHELVTSPRHIDQRVGAKQLAQGRYLNAEIVFCDHQPGPDAVNQLIFRDDPVAVFHQALQQVKRARTEIDQSTFSQHLTCPGQDFKAIKSVAATQLGLRHKELQALIVP